MRNKVATLLLLGLTVKTGWHGFLNAVPQT